MYETIKKFLAEGGKCLLIENGQPIGVVLTMEEYELLRSKSSAYTEASAGKKILNLKSQNENIKPEVKEEIPEISKSEFNTDDNSDVENPIGASMVEEMDFPSASANIDEINLADAGDVTLEDLGLDELPY